MTNTKKTRTKLATALFAALALIATPTFADYETGMDYYKQGKHVESIAEFEAVVTNAPEYDFGYYMIGLNYLKLKKYNDAILNIKKAIDLNPGKADYHVYLSYSQFYAKRYTDVVTTLDKAESLIENPSHKATMHQLRGLALAQNKQFARAIPDLKKANPGKDFSVAAALGAACRAASDWPCALDAYKKAVALKPNDKRVLNQLVSTELEVAQRETNGSRKPALYNAAAASAKKLVALEKSADSHKKYGDALLGAKKYDQAVSEYQTVLKMEPRNCAAMLSISQAMVPLEKWQDTISWAEKSIACGDKKHLGYNQKAFAYIKLQDWDKAIQAADASLKVKDNNAAKGFKRTAVSKKETEMHNAEVEAERARYEAEIAAEEARIAEEERKRKEYEARTGKKDGSR
jgi:tetratricopeptide (TPR) repeat protein